MSKNGVYEDKSGMGAVPKLFRLVHYCIWYNWCAGFGRSFSCNNTWLLLR